MASFHDLSHLWSTLTEIDTGAIREQVQTPLRVAILGSDAAAAHWLADALRADPFSGDLISLPRTLGVYLLPVGAEALQEAARADLTLFVLPAAQEDIAQPVQAYRALRAENQAQTVVVLHLTGEKQLERLGAERRNWRGAAEILADPDAADALAATLIPTLLRLFPDRHVALAHHLPALRAAVARDLIQEASLANAGYAASTGLAEILPVFTIPFNVADMVVLTKNQALLAYKLALALGQDISVQQMATQLAGVLGGGFIWREMARRLVGFIPVWGLLPKIAVAYAGTYATGMAVFTWYAHGRKLTPARMRQLYKEAAIEGKARAKALIPKKRPHLRLPLPRRKHQKSIIFD